jgi:hypothetical protein
VVFHLRAEGGGVPHEEDSRPFCLRCRGSQNLGNPKSSRISVNPGPGSYRVVEKLLIGPINKAKDRMPHPECCVHSTKIHPRTGPKEAKAKFDDSQE